MLREVDSIERILDDAGKTYVKYWGCDQSRACRSDCPAANSTSYALYGETHEDFHAYGERVKRPEPADTQEKIDDDATMPQVVYVACVLCKDTRDMDGDEMQTLMIRDLLRRQRELRGGEAR